MATTHRFSTSHRKNAFAGASLSSLLLLALTGCGAGDFIEKQTADAWSVTYEVTVSGTAINALDEVTYLDSPSRGEKSEPTPAERVATTNDPDHAGTAVWKETAMVTAEHEAGVSATPLADATAVCRILLDDEREISSVTGTAGERVECAASTPAFENE